MADAPEEIYIVEGSVGDHVNPSTSSEDGHQVEGLPSSEGMADPAAEGIVSSTQQQEALVEAVSSITADQANAAVADSTGDMEGMRIVTLNEEQAREFLVPHTDNTTLQSLLSTPTSDAHQIFASHPEGIQIITVNNAADLLGGNAELIATGKSSTGGKVWQIMHPGMANSGEIATIIAVSQPDEENGHAAEQVECIESNDAELTAVTSTVPEAVTTMALLPPPQPPQNLPPGCPAWAARLKDCEAIGDSYRGWVESEVELDLLLTYHKQQTMSFWGTRQSPNPSKPSTRLMWKSQYVSFDGIPFLNTGSRAVVMECQYGPRRKGTQTRKQPDGLIKGDFKNTCPARIYIKKVRKFPEFRVDPTLDKKTLKFAMDKAFQELKSRGTDGLGQDRFYVQLPTDKAHEYHNEQQQQQQQQQSVFEPAPVILDSRLHPRVAKKIRDIVSSGETRLYAIRKQLRRFVEKELFESAEMVPEKHNLTYYPTVNDLQNHIHNALRDVELGRLPMTAQSLNVEVITSGAGDGSSSQERGAGLEGGEQALWAQVSAEEPHAETVTVTLTQNPGEDGHHIISRVETHLSDGTTQVSTSLTPETAQLLAKLHPNMFPAGSIIQMQSSQQLPAVDSGMQAVMTEPQVDANQQVVDQINTNEGHMEMHSQAEEETPGLVAQDMENHGLALEIVQDGMQHEVPLISVAMAPDGSEEVEKLVDTGDVGMEHDGQLHMGDHLQMTSDMVKLEHSDSPVGVLQQDSGAGDAIDS